MSFATITPTRHDRPKLLNFCKQQLDRMTLKPDRAYVIDYEPTSKNIDLVDRVKLGFEMASNDGHEYAFIIENDDFYSPDYFKSFEAAMQRGDDFLGTSSTTYYNLKNKTWQKFDHPGRSSLFCTGFRLRAMEKFNWPRNSTIMLDLYIWAHAKLSKHATKYFHKEPIALGIKHGIGLCGGKAHKMELKHRDEHYAFLKSSVDLEAFKFYVTL